MQQGALVMRAAGKCKGFEDAAPDGVDGPRTPAEQLEGLALLVEAVGPNPRHLRRSPGKRLAARGNHAKLLVLTRIREIIVKEGG